MKYFEITGFWKDSKEKFSNRIVASQEYNETVPEYIDEQIFFYGLDQNQLEDCVTFGWNTDLEFIILDFKEVGL